MIKGKFRLPAAIFCSVLIFLPAIVHAKADPRLRNKAIEESLCAIEAKMQPSPKVLSSASEKFFRQDLRLDDAYLTLGLEFGYIKGNTAYDFNHHTSELEFPMDNWMVGGNFSLGYKNLSFNTEVWTPLENDAGFNMKDKDWVNGILALYSKSKAEMDAIICDANLRYDFYKKVLSQDIKELMLSKSDEITIGALLGYRYERFDYDMYDLCYEVDLLYGHQGQTLYQGTKVLSYKIKYYLPYLGLAADISRKNWGLGMNIKYSFHPTAKDVDNHLLRGLTFFGDYDKHGEALMGNVNAFLKINKNCKLKMGLDATFIRIDGITWEDLRDPGWDKDQSTDARHWIFWSGVEYKF